MMFREKSITKLYAFALAAVFALALAGCGGGGGGTAAVDEEPAPMPTPQEMCEADGGRYNMDGSCTSAADLAAEMAEATALSDAQDAAAAAATAAMAAVYAAVDPVAAQNAHAHASAAQAASASAQAATTSADAMGYQAMAEEARDSAMEAGGTRGLGITREANQITNQAAIDNAILEGQDAPDPVSNATRVGTELDTLTVAATGAVIRNETPDDPGTTAADPVANGSVSQGDTDSSVRAAYGANGPTLTVSGVGDNLLLGESPVGVIETRGGWQGRELVQNADSDTHVIVFTDIQAPVMRQNYGTTTTSTADDAGNAAVLAVGQIITGDIPGDGSTFTGTRNVSATDNIPTQTGRFFCEAGTACAISVDEDGEITGVVGYGWQPIASGTTPATDDDYLAWGVWLTVPDAAPADATPAAAGAFASGNDVFEVRAELTGTATYEGVATGLYAAGGAVEYFDADVSLTANFGGAVGADSTPGSAVDDPATPQDDDNDGFLLGAVTGSVSNIMAGGMAVDGSLTLRRAPIVTDAVDGNSSAGFSGATRGTLAGRAMTGLWGGQFYGPNDAAADTMPARTEYPTTAAGTFSASAPGNANDPVRILGSFGSWKAD